MSEKFDFTAVNEILSVHASNRAAVIAILQDIQEYYRYLPKEIFPYLSQKLGISQARVYSVATFYENFSLNPKGKYVIRVCDGTACHVVKSIPILERLRSELGLSETKVTCDDLSFTVETVSCLGAPVSPLLLPSMTKFTRNDLDKASELLKTAKEEL